MSEPALSVVIPSVNGWDELADCLAALERERDTVEIEVLVPERCGQSVRERIASRFPWAVVLPVPVTTTIPEMRATAFDRATAPSVAVIEDHILVPRGWAHDLLIARQTEQVVGGSIRNAATERGVDWAAFLCDYSHLLPPLPAGARPWIAGNNTVYDRRLLERYRDATHSGRWEDHLHDTLRGAGVSLCCVPAIVVDHRKHYTVGEFLAQRFLYARSHSAARVAGWSGWRRFGFGLAALGLPPILFWRVASSAWRKGLPGWLVVRTAPLVAIFVTAWAAGEVTGAWTGAGTSLARVR